MTEKLKITRGSGNVFLDVGFPPGEAENLQLWHRENEHSRKLEEIAGIGPITASAFVASTRRRRVIA